MKIHQQTRPIFMQQAPHLPRVDSTLRVPVRRDIAGMRTEPIEAGHRDGAGTR